METLYHELETLSSIFPEIGNPLYRAPISALYEAQ